MNRFCPIFLLLFFETTKTEVVPLQTENPPRSLVSLGIDCFTPIRKGVFSLTRWRCRWSRESVSHAFCVAALLSSQLPPERKTRVGL